MKDASLTQPESEVILLLDLIPRESVKGGGKKFIFGQPLDYESEPDAQVPTKETTKESAPDKASFPAVNPYSNK